MNKRAKVLALLLVLGAVILAVLGLFAYRAASRIALASLNFRGNAYWEYAFLKNLPVLPQDSSFGMHDIHPTRGWTPKAERVRPGATLRLTNNKGHRAIKDYVFEPEKFTVMIVGDSLTYGLEDDNEAVWPIHLQQRDERLSVVNLAVSGYGVDQMYITLREEIETYKPQLVIFPPISDDLCRSLLCFREYQKPRFVDDAGKELRLTNVPVPPLPETWGRIHRQYGGITGTFRLLLEDRQVRRSINNGDFDKEWASLNTRIIEEAIGCTRRHNAEFMLVHLACNLEIGAANAKKEDANPSEALLRGIAEKEHVDFVPSRAAFLDAGTGWTLGHYTVREAQFLAALIHERILQSASWKAFLAK